MPAFGLHRSEIWYLLPPFCGMGERMEAQAPRTRARIATARCQAGTEGTSVMNQKHVLFPIQREVTFVLWFPSQQIQNRTESAVVLIRFQKVIFNIYNRNKDNSRFGYVF